MNKITTLLLALSAGLSLCSSTLMAETVLEGHTELGFGYDSNPFRTPGDTYVDYSTAATPTIVPDKKSGFFTPIDIGVDLSVDLNGNSALFAEYDFDGRVYYGSDLQNANRYHHGLKAGALYRFTKSKKYKHQLSVALLGSDHYEIYVDKDNGEYKNTQYDGTGTDIPERYQYRSVGAELTYERERKRYDYFARLTYKQYDYPKPDAWSQLDYTYYKVALGGEYRFAKRYSAELEVSHYVKDYTDRPSYEYNATAITLLSSNPAVTYTYDRIKAGLRYKVKRLLRLKADYAYTHRTDEHQGYNDYNYHRVRLFGTYTLSPALHADAGVKQYWQQYPTALAFDEIGQDAKYYNGTEVKAALRYRYDKHFYFGAECLYNTQSSSDKRYEYDRIQGLLSAKVKF